MNYIQIIQNKPVISTSIIAKQCEIEHRSILQNINKRKEDFLSFGQLLEDKEKGKGKKGRPFEIYYLNEEHFVFLITLLQNSKKAVIFKKQITQEFFRMRKQLLEIKMNQQNQEWLEAREKGKLTRIETTSIYKEYLEYAIESGSEHYKKKPNDVYSNFTRMINKALFDFEFKIPKNKSSRDYMNHDQLTILETAELAAQRLIHSEINKSTKYKEIFQIVKKEMIKYSDFIGKSTIIDLINGSEVKLLDTK